MGRVGGLFDVLFDGLFAWVGGWQECSGWAVGNGCYVGCMGYDSWLDGSCGLVWAIGLNTRYHVAKFKVDWYLQADAWRS